MSSQAPGSEIEFRAFLSHAYAAASTNQYFFELFADRAQLYFHVDEGFRADKGKRPTNVTRLERFIRDADAFVGIYAMPETAADLTIEPAQARTRSRYFRLELDIALRCAKPGLIFVDQRFRNAIEAPPMMAECRFDPADIGQSHRGPSRQKHAEHITQFLKVVAATQSRRAASAHLPQPDDRRVGVLLTPEYSPQHLALIQKQIEDHGQNPEIVAWPERLDFGFYQKIQRFDWIVVDLADSPVGSMLVSFLHGWGVPMMRLQQREPGSTKISRTEHLLLGAYDAGYPTDIVRWSTTTELETKLGERLTRLHERPRSIGDTGSARSYFREAERSKEPVFISYSGRDQQFVAGVVAKLKTKFERVFDYKDGTSIVPGKPWLSEIFANILEAPFGVIMLSPSYLSSGNCQHEAQEMVAQRDAGKMTVIPVKLDSDVISPPYLDNVQYIHAIREGSPTAVADKILWSIDRLRQAGNSLGAT